MARSNQASSPQYLAFPSPYALLNAWVPNVSSIGDVFIAWQCRLRQKAIGRPLPGMRPRLTSPDGREIAPFITVLLVENEPEATTDFLRHIIRKTQDPRQRYEEGLRVLSSSFYQHPENFSDFMTGTFSTDSAVATALLQDGRCLLHFQQGRQLLHPLQRRGTPGNAAAYQATYWHNHLFNASLPPKVRLLAFVPIGPKSA